MVYTQPATIGRIGALLLCGALIATVITPALTHADTHTVSTTIIASAQSGGNTVVGGNATIIAGTPTNTVRVLTKVNGSVVEDFAKTTTDGTPIVYRKTITYPSATTRYFVSTKSRAAR